MNVEQQEYDYSEDFDPDELYEYEKEKGPKYQTFEEKLREVGMSIHDFI